MNAIPDIITPGADGALTIFDKTYAPADLFAPGACDPLIERIKSEIRKEVTDPSTEEGRKYIKSLAYKVTKSKTAIEAARVTLVSDEKKRLAAIDAEGKRIRETLEAFADEVRQPVTDFEDREKERISKHETALEDIKRLIETGGMTTAQLAERVAKVQAVDVSGFEEFTTIAAGVKAQTLEVLSARLEASRKADAEREELERLRREAAERAQRDREEAAAKLSREQAEAAAREREDAIKRESEARERAAQEAAERAEREKKEAQERAEQAERNRLDAEKRAEEARIAAEADARRREEEAIQRERDRQAAEKRAEDEAAAKREADRAHRSRINNEILSALMASGEVVITEAMAKVIISSIAKGAIPHVRITY